MKDERWKIERNLSFSAINLYKTEERSKNLMDVENREILFCDFHVS